MNIQEAVRFINHEVVWEPGLRVTARMRRAEFWTGYDIDELVMTLTLETVDSNSISPNGHYPTGPDALTEVGFSRVVPSYAYSTPEELLYRVIRMISELREHETREFTRVRYAPSKWVAPFYPHDTDGNELFRHAGRPYIKKNERKEAGA